ncbi:MAG: TonB-dependent receptor [Alphaproteobacteria bacterium]
MGHKSNFVRALALCGGVMVTGIVQAQEQAANPDLEALETAENQPQTPGTAPATESATRAPNPKLDEVLVTATMRATDIQDVPLSIHAIGEEELEDRGVDSLGELTHVVPAFSLGVADGGIGGSISMRGITSSNNRGMDQGVAILVDDIYYGRIEYAVDNFLDVERVEILRGPQGTLFGKNSTTGAIALHTKDPDYDGFMLDATAVGLISLKGGAFGFAMNAPIIDEYIGSRIAFRSHFAQLLDYVNTYEPEATSYQRKNVGRAKLRFDPTQNLNIVLAVDGVKSDTQGAFTQIASSDAFWDALNRNFDPEYETDDSDKRTSLDQTPFLFKDSITFNGQAKWQVAPDWMLTYTGGYSTFDQGTNGEIDFMPAPILTVQIEDTFTQSAHELRLLSPEGLMDGHLSFVGGLFYFWANFDGVGRIGALETPSLYTTLAPLVGNPAVLQLVESLGLASVADIPFAQDGSTLTFDQITKSYAAYGQAELTVFDDQIVLTGGLRYTYETKEIDIERTFDNTGAAFNALVGYEEFHVMDDRSESSIAPRVSLRWRMTDDIMIFGTYGKGFKSGGYNANAGVADEVEYTGEESDTYEIGFKAEFFDNALRLNTTYFWTEITDFQFSMFNGLQFVVTNAAQVRSRGMEADFFAALPFDIVAMGGLGVTDTVFTSFPDAPCKAGDDGPCDLSGEQTPFPRLTASLAVMWLNKLGDLPIDMVLGADASWRDDTFLDFDLDPGTFQPAYTIVNSFIRFQGDDESWNISLRVENMFDQFHRTTMFDAPLAAGTFVSIPGGFRGIGMSANFVF